MSSWIAPLSFEIKDEFFATMFDSRLQVGFFFLLLLWISFVFRFFIRKVTLMNWINHLILILGASSFCVYSVTSSKVIPRAQPNSRFHGRDIFREISNLPWKCALVWNSAKKLFLKYLSEIYHVFKQPKMYCVSSWVPFRCLLRWLISQATEKKIQSSHSCNLIEVIEVHCLERILTAASGKIINNSLWLTLHKFTARGCTRHTHSHASFLTLTRRSSDEVCDAQWGNE